MESTVWEEKHLNPRLTKTLEEFIELMDNLKLPYPKKIGEYLKLLVLFMQFFWFLSKSKIHFFYMFTLMIDVALPANLECGLYDIPQRPK